MVTLHHLEPHNGRYFAPFHKKKRARFRGQLNYTLKPNWSYSICRRVLPLNFPWKNDNIFSLFVQRCMRSHRSNSWALVDHAAFCDENVRLTVRQSLTPNHSCVTPKRVNMSKYALQLHNTIDVAIVTWGQILSLYQGSTHPNDCVNETCIHV